MFVAESLEDGRAIKDRQGTMAVLHLQEQTRFPSTGDMECLIASFITALDAGTHALIANVACQLPSGFRYLFNIHHWLHEGMVPKGDLGNPHSTE